MWSYILLGIPIGVLLSETVRALFKTKKKKTLPKPYYDEQEKKLYFSLDKDYLNIYDFSEDKPKNKL